MPKLKVIFAGTPDFAASSLTALLAHPSVTVIAVYTQPEKPAGRGQQLRESAVKTLAIAAGLPIFQPHSLREAQAVADFAALSADLLVVGRPIRDAADPLAAARSVVAEIQAAMVKR